MYIKRDGKNILTLAHSSSLLKLIKVGIMVSPFKMGNEVALQTAVSTIDTGH